MSAPQSPLITAAEVQAFSELLAPPTIKFVDGAELAADITPPDWVIHDLMESDSLGMIFGPSGGGKSFVALDWACCVATGKAWRSYEIVRQGQVIYIVGEGYNGIRRRLRAWEQHHELKLPKGRVHVSECAADLSDPMVAAGLQSAIKSLCKGINPPLIIIDTLARSMTGDENSSKDIGIVIKHVDQYLRRPFKATVLIVHHTGHGSTERARGSSAIRAALDFEVGLERNDAGAGRLFCTKAKEAEPFADMGFRLESIELTNAEGRKVVDRGKFLCSAVAIEAEVSLQAAKSDRLGVNQIAALKALSELFDEHVATLAEAGHDTSDAWVLLTDWRVASGLESKRFYDVRKAFVERNLIEVKSMHCRPTQPSEPFFTENGE